MPACLRAFAKLRRHIPLVIAFSAFRDAFLPRSLCAGLSHRMHSIHMFALCGGVGLCLLLQFR